jgi:uncharacterized protein
MTAVDLLALNLLSPVVLAFVLGAVAALVRSDLRIPEEVHTALAIYLLLAIGLKGGAELSQVAPAEVAWPLLATLGLGILTPVMAYAVLRRRLDVANAAAMAAHYGSVSVVTYSAALAFTDAVGAPSERYTATLVAVLEVPAIVIALLIARVKLGGGESWRVVMHEVFAGRGVLLLVGGLVIGYVSGAAGFARVAPLFVDLFQGALMLFLLEMGLVAARRLRDFRQVGGFLFLFAILMPVFNGALGAALGTLVGMSLGGATVLGVMAASASYIAAPAAVRIALPQANPSIYLTSALGITFPFNLTLGIPLYYAIARVLQGA